MSYQVLARKLRPTVFSELVGQEHVVKALTHALDNDRLHHAYLFTGTRGVGKTTIARILARSLNCEEGVSSTPCGVCGICREVLEGRFVDLLEVDAASRTGVDDTRDLLDNAQYLPTRGRYKVYLIDEVHMLSKAAFNALLKTLEEPPPHVVFLLATTDPRKLPVTVLSRCLQFQLKNLSAEAIQGYLETILTVEGIDFETEALAALAQAARGSMRDALSVTDQAIAHGGGTVATASVLAMLGTAGRDALAALLDTLRGEDPASLLALCAELAERSVDFRALLEALIAEWHRLAVALATGGDGEGFDAETVQLNYQISLLGLKDFGVLSDQRLAFEMVALRLLAFAPVAPPPASAVPGATALADGSDNQTAEPLPSRASASSDAPEPEPEPELEPKAKVARKTSATPVDPAPAERAMGPSTAAPTPTVAIAADAADAWWDLVNEMRLTGVTRMLAEHALPLTLTPQRVVLALDAEHDMLLSEAQVERLRQGIAEVRGSRPDLVVELHRLDRETPAARRMRERDAHRAAVVARVATHPLVVELQRQFGADIQRVALLDEFDDNQQPPELAP
ncbi:MAG: DNA polymerase III subunit gamma/tau [Pseudomonadota bacterium]